MVWLRKEKAMEIISAGSSFGFERILVYKRTSTRVQRHEHMCTRYVGTISIWNPFAGSYLPGSFALRSQPTLQHNGNQPLLTLSFH